MGRNDHIFDVPLEDELTNCKKCNKTYFCSRTEQIPGFRDMEEERCPYCGEINAKSMTYDYFCRQLSENDKEYLRNKGIKFNE